MPVSSQVPGAGIAWFPLVGGLIGGAGAAVYWAGHLLAPPLLSALASVTAVILLTGALHEDGLADFADALGSGMRGKGALDVMADPRVGTFGALALVISLSWRVAAVAALEPGQALAGLVMAHTLARSGPVVLSGTLPPVRPAGLARSFSDGNSPRAKLVAAVGGVVVALAAAGFWALPAAFLAGGAVLAVRRSARRLLGGLTGDVLGACEQTIEIVVLTMVVATTGVSIPLWEGLL